MREGARVVFRFLVVWDCWACPSGREGVGVERTRGEGDEWIMDGWGIL